MDENQTQNTTQTPKSSDMYNLIPESREEAEKLISFYRDEDVKNRQSSWELIDGKQEPEQDKQEVQAETQVKRQEQTPNEYSFEIDGQVKKFSQEDLQKYVSEGLKATQKYQEIMDHQQKLMQEKANFEQNVGKYDHYRKIDEWARENPELYNRIQLEHENMVNGGNFGDVPPYLAKFVSEIDSIKAKLGEVDQLISTQKANVADQQLDKTFAQYAQEYPMIDWQGKDQNGLTMMQKAYNYAQKFGLSTVESALDRTIALEMKDIIARSELKAKDQVAKQVQKNNKLGILEKSERYTPSEKTLRKPKTYEDALQMALNNFN